MGASEWGKPPSALRAKGVEKEEEDNSQFISYLRSVSNALIISVE
jgi:hypothetical protein